MAEMILRSVPSICRKGCTLEVLLDFLTIIIIVSDYYCLLPDQDIVRVFV